MTLAVLANETLKQEILSKGVPENVTIIWADSLRSLLVFDADAYMDLQFEQDVERTEKLRRLSSKPVVVNAVAYTTKDIGSQFIRINAWPGMLKRPIVEVAAGNKEQEANAESLFNSLQWKYQLVPDVPGFITARILAMIINEAYHTWGAGVSSKEDIDIAMKLGTNYPMGPFEWAKMIGESQVAELLHELSRTDKRYLPAESLTAQHQSLTN